MATGGWHPPKRTILERFTPLFFGKVPLFLAGHNHSTELLPVTPDLMQAVCGGGAGLDNAYGVAEVTGTLEAFSHGGWCFLRFYEDVLAIELYNRAGILRHRHLIEHPKPRKAKPSGG
jgi:hypothetical protein